MNAQLATAVLVPIVVVGATTPASAQIRGPVEIGAVVRAERVFAEAGAGRTVPVAGIAASIPIFRSSSAEIELTRAAGDFARSYEGWFMSYVTKPNPTREEIEAEAPWARRTDRYQPGIGWAAAWAVRTDPTARVSVGGRAGVSARRYRETSSYDVLTIPPGVDPVRVARDFATETRLRTRSGLLIGADVAFRLTPRLVLVPEARFVYGGPARVGSKHRELAGGVQLHWRM